MTLGRGHLEGQTTGQVLGSLGLLIYGTGKYRDTEHEDAAIKNETFFHAELLDEAKAQVP